MKAAVIVVEPTLTAGSCFRPGMKHLKHVAVFDSSPEPSASTVRLKT